MLLVGNGCITHDTIPVVIKVPAFYPFKKTEQNLLVIADPYNEKSKVRYIFGKDIRKKGIYPVHLILQNQGDAYFDISATEAVLFNEYGDAYYPIRSDEAAHTLLRDTNMQMIGYGLLGSALLVMTVPFALSAGISSVRTNEAIEEDIQHKQFAKEMIRPNELCHGFLFFNLKNTHDISLDMFQETYSIMLRHVTNINEHKDFDVMVRMKGAS